jgi:sugar phosphate isomerase/epimerase
VRAPAAVEALDLEQAHAEAHRALREVVDRQPVRAGLRRAVDREALGSEAGGDVGVELAARRQQRALVGCVTAARVADVEIDVSYFQESIAWKRVRQAGVQFAYHNHNFEFYPREDAGGRLPMDIVLESCDPSLVKIELDLCWIASARKDPLEYFRRYPGRFPMVHVKGLREVPAASAQPVPIDRVLPNISDVGHDDVIDWPRIFAHSKEAGIKHYFVEHDNPKQPFESLRNSYDYVSRLNF